ncbi:hypothetical protein M5D96_007810 [Drosophila gunungcola]|uniref:Uncharacterized protein n=1 Tax=Drosophila gunungcola TaxID=103775 RepID=A0A9Q0BPH0_9MUSC|nr:hypothetical protein M5D96_007810 [Drosophila gunungcola]
MPKLVILSMWRLKLRGSGTIFHVNNDSHVRQSPSSGTNLKWSPQAPQPIFISNSNGYNLHFKIFVACIGKSVLRLFSMHAAQTG